MIEIKAPKDKKPTELWGVKFLNGTALAKELKPSVKDWFTKHRYIIKEIKEKVKK